MTSTPGLYGPDSARTLYARRPISTRQGIRAGRDLCAELYDLYAPRPCTRGGVLKTPRGGGATHNARAETGHRHESTAQRQTRRVRADHREDNYR